MDWFQRLTGFPERGYEETRALLTVEGEHLVSLANGSRHRIGQLELPSLAELRSQAGGAGFGQPLRVSIMQGDARGCTTTPASTARFSRWLRSSTCWR